MATADIEVFGGGIFGLTVAFFLQERGAQVRLIEKRVIGAGASGGVLGALAPHTPDNWNDKKQFQFESLIATPDFWAKVDRLSGLRSGFGQIGRLVPLETPRELELAQMRVKTAAEFWRGHAEWRVVENSEFEGWAVQSASGFHSFDTLSARISPRAACATLAAAFQAIGGTIVEGTTASKGAAAEVWCTGFEGLDDLSRDLGQVVGIGEKGQGLLLDYQAGDVPQLFASGVHFIPHAGGKLAIGSTSERDWQEADSTDDQLEELLRKACGICPSLQGAPVLKRWAGVRPRANKRTPMLGRHPLHDDVFIANGGFKIGFGVAVKAGEVMADLVLNGAADIPEGFLVEAHI
ncbi:MAG: FAD-binding oxidoreductase [Alphaproteobacteria bacterium]|nr:FAD-binding oxidoreductase [Alphaproteobacteria bacterium]